MIKNLLNRLDKKRLVLLITSLSLLFALAIGTTLAYLFDSTPSISNTFTPSNVGIDVDEKIEGNVKEYVQIKNEGDIDVYIRVMVVVSWKDDSGNVYAVAPTEGTDYSITWTGLEENGGWKKGKDGFYYYTASVRPNDSTRKLFTECELKDGVNPPDGYNLSVNVISQAIQAHPKTAVKEAWNIDVNDDDGSLKIDESYAGGIQ